MLIFFFKYVLFGQFYILYHRCDCCFFLSGFVANSNAIWNVSYIFSLQGMSHNFVLQNIVDIIPELLPCVTLRNYEHTSLAFRIFISFFII